MKLIITYSTEFGCEKTTVKLKDLTQWLKTYNFNIVSIKKYKKTNGFAIGVLEEVDNSILHQIGNSFDYFTAHDVIDNKIQELKQYLNE